jgi:hypothetical protein
MVKDQELLAKGRRGLRIAKAKGVGKVVGEGVGEAEVMSCHEVIRRR